MMIVLPIHRMITPPLPIVSLLSHGATWRTSDKIQPYHTTECSISQSYDSDGALYLYTRIWSHKQGEARRGLAKSTDVSNLVLLSLFARTHSVSHLSLKRVSALLKETIVGNHKSFIRVETHGMPQLSVAWETPHLTAKDQ